MKRGVLESHRIGSPFSARRSLPTNDAPQIMFLRPLALTPTQQQRYTAGPHQPCAHDACAPPTPTKCLPVTLYTFARNSLGRHTCSVPIYHSLHSLQALVYHVIFVTMAVGRPDQCPLEVNTSRRG